MPIDNFESPPNWSVLKNLSEDASGNLLYKSLSIAGSGGTGATQQAQVIYADSNWSLAKGYLVQDIYWRSREDSSGEAGTGKLEVGNFQIKNKLCLPVAGGGGTNGNLKILEIVRVSDSVVLASYSLSTLIGGANTDALTVAIFSTSNWINSICLLRFKDLDAGGSWSWFGVDVSRIYCY